MERVYFHNHGAHMGLLPPNQQYYSTNGMVGKRSPILEQDDPSPRQSARRWSKP